MEKRTEKDFIPRWIARVHMPAEDAEPGYFSLHCSRRHAIRVLRLEPKLSEWVSAVVQNLPRSPDSERVRLGDGSASVKSACKAVLKNGRR